jgi:aerobic C4-dicarboxylate transport protein
MIGKGDISKYTKEAAETSHGVVDFLVSIVPDNVIGAMGKGELLPVLFFSILFGLALAKMGEKGKPILHLFEKLSDVFFGIVGFVMKFSPFAAFGAMAYTIGKFGIGSLTSLGSLMLGVYVTMFLLIGNSVATVVVAKMENEFHPPSTV